MHETAHLPAGICDLAASLANYARLESVCRLLFGLRGKKDAEARVCGDLPFKLMTSLMMKASGRTC